VMYFNVSFHNKKNICFKTFWQSYLLNNKLKHNFYYRQQYDFLENRIIFEK